MSKSKKNCIGVSIPLYIHGRFP